jgi:hypothetical protein
MTERVKVRQDDRFGQRETVIPTVWHGCALGKALINRQFGQAIKGLNYI